MSRDVPFFEDDICDVCGAVGAYDFMGDLLCPECTNKAIQGGPRRQKMWRPPDWAEDKFYKCMDLTKGGGDYADIYEVFEAGANTLWDALWKLAEESPTGTFVLDSRVVGVYELCERCGYLPCECGL